LPSSAPEYRLLTGHEGVAARHGLTGREPIEHIVRPHRVAVLANVDRERRAAIEPGERVGGTDLADVRRDLDGHLRLLPASVLVPLPSSVVATNALTAQILCQARLLRGRAACALPCQARIQLRAP